MSQRIAHRLAFLALALCGLAGEAAWADRYDGRPYAGSGYQQPYQQPYQPQPYQPQPYQPQPYQQPPPYGYPGYANDPRDNGLPASVRRIQRETGGQVLRAEPYERDGREVYRVKVLTPQGRIRVYEDDPGAGRGPPPADQRPPPASEPASGRDPRFQRMQQPPPFQQPRQPPYQPPRGRRHNG